jgi:hypothetical protein
VAALLVVELVAREEGLNRRREAVLCVDRGAKRSFWMR